MDRSESQFLLYQTADNKTRILVRLEGETVWLSQKQMAELFDKDVRTINEHLRNVFDEGELGEDSVIRNFRITATDGKQYDTLHYSLDAIISVGYRVRSHRGTQFRMWATQRLRDYLIKGFTVDKDRLMGNLSEHDYFDELLEIVREIRASERRFYQKITDIYATSIDYDKNAAVTRDFFATVQNKFHYAITGLTAAEIVASRARAEKPNMGLTSWKGSKVRRPDVSVAKNYLQEDEIRALNLIVDQYLSFAEAQAQRRIPMRMAEWIAKLHGFLTLNDREILKDAGRISSEAASERANREYDRFEAKRKEIEAIEPVSDFDHEVKRIASERKPPPAAND